MNLDGLNIRFSTQEPEAKKRHYPMIFLIISSNGSPCYKKMRECWKLYMNNYSEYAKCYFLENNPSQNCDVYVDEDENTIIFKHVENLIPGVLLKSIIGMYVCNKYYTFDYMIRTNLSSVYFIPKLWEKLCDFPRRDFIGGEKDVDNSYFPFVSGAGIVLSCDVIEEILRVVTTYGISDYRLSLPDDVAISHILIYSFRETQIQRIEMYNCVGEITEEMVQTLCQDENICHFRSRNDIDRNIDVENMKRLSTFGKSGAKMERTFHF